MDTAFYVYLQIFGNVLPCTVILGLVMAMLWPIVQKEKAQPAIYLMIIAGLQATKNIIGLVSFFALSGSIDTPRYVVFFLIPNILELMGFLVIALFADSLTRDALNPIKTVVIFSLASCYQAFAIAAFYLAPFIAAILYGFIVLNLIYITAIILKHAPPQAKKRGRWLLVSDGLWILYLITTFQSIRILTDQGIIYLSISTIFIAVPLLIVAVVFRKSPELMHILPFKAIRLAVIHTQSGLAIFSHSWKSGETMVEDELFGGMIQGITSFVKELVGKGDVRELWVEQGVFIFHREAQKNLVFVLVATRSSRILRNSLRGFATQFIADFGSNLDNPHEMNQFKAASVLVGKYFPFIQ